MDRQVVIEAALQLIRADRPFVLATVDAEGCPQVRWMGAAHYEWPATIYMAAFADSRKMAQINGHPQAQLMFHSEGFKRVATLSGTARVVADPAVKRRVFAEMLDSSDYFEGPDDPRFGLIAFVFTRIEAIGLGDDMTPAAVDI